MRENLVSGLGRGSWKPSRPGNGLRPWWEPPGVGSRAYRPPRHRPTLQAGFPVTGGTWSDPACVLGGLLGCALLELFFRVHLGLGGVEDGLLGDDASLDLRV